MSRHDSLWINATLTVITEEDLPETLEDAAIGCRDGVISMICTMADLPHAATEMATKVHDVEHACITPGLVDCHTHLVFGGHRADEFKLRLKGQSYAQIAEGGGGIISTVRNTRAASDQQLQTTAQNRLQYLIEDGVTTLEIKSGYGLTIADEEKMLRVVRKIGATSPVTIVSTFLGAHALPPEYATDRDGYVDLLCRHMLPRLHAAGLIDAVDGFCEGIAFTPDEIERLYQVAASLGLPVKLHAEQLSNSGGTQLAARYGALSVDHLEYLDEDGARAMAASGSVAVLLPGAYLMLRETQPPPVALLRKHGVAMALASDANPGSSPALSARLMMLLGCQQFNLTPREALWGMTLHAARALGMADSIGSLEVGKAADMVVWDVRDAAELSYWLGGNMARSVIKDGVVIHHREALLPSL